MGEKIENFGSFNVNRCRKIGGKCKSFGTTKKKKKKKKNLIDTHMAAFKVFNLSVKGGRSFKIY
jgi:hypothetical protein